MYQNDDGSFLMHQMLLDRVENREYVLQNTLIEHEGTEHGTQLRIPLDRPYYASDINMMYRLSSSNYVYKGDNNEIINLVHEKVNSEKWHKGEWYLLPQAYSITLSYKPAITTAIKNLKAVNFNINIIIL